MYSTYAWLGRQFQDQTFSKELDFNALEIRELLDEDYNKNKGNNR
jgi:hypothetical protein